MGIGAWVLGSTIVRRRFWHDTSSWRAARSTGGKVVCCAASDESVAGSPGDGFVEAAAEADGEAAADGEGGLPLFIDAMPLCRMWRCRACKKTLKSKYDLTTHVQGKQHLANVRQRQLMSDFVVRRQLEKQAKGNKRLKISEAKISGQGGEGSDAVGQQRGVNLLQGEEIAEFCEEIHDGGQYKYRCTLCNTKVQNMEMLMAHVKGQKHNKKLVKAGQPMHPLASFEAQREVMRVGGVLPTGEKSEAWEVFSPIANVKAALQRRHLRDSIAAVEEAAAATGGGAAAALQEVAAKLPQVLKLASRSTDSMEYCEALKLFVDLNAKIKVKDLADVLESLTCRSQVSPALVRLTLSLLVPEGRPGIPIVAPGMTEPEDIAAVFAGVTPALQKVLQESEVDRLVGRCEAPDKEALAYFGHFMPLLHLEFLDEVHAVRQTWVRELESNEAPKHSLRNLTASPGYGGQIALRPAESDGLQPFAVGDSVVLSRNGPMQEGANFLGVVLRLPRSAAKKAASDDSSDLSECLCIGLDRAVSKDILEAPEADGWRLDKTANFVAYRRQLNALAGLCGMPVQQRLPIQAIVLQGQLDGKQVDAWTEKMRRVLQMADNSQKDASKDARGKVEPSEAGALFPDPSTPSSSSGSSPPTPVNIAELAAEEVMPLKSPFTNAGVQTALQSIREELLFDDLDGLPVKLNEAQKEAIAAALGRRLTLIQGPPGTGKTEVSGVLLWLWRHKVGTGPILATSNNNVAVDNIAAKALRYGLRVVRVGGVGMSAKIDDAVLEGVTLNSLARAKRRGRLQEHWRNCIDASRGQTAAMDNVGAANPGDELEGDSEEDKGLEATAADMQAVLKDADVVCATTNTAAASMLRVLNFEAVLIDEVAQATELSALVPIVLRGANRLVLVGDHCQLPPSVNSLEAEARGLSLSLFARLEAQGIAPHFLDTQFRMHPAVAEFSANAFYNGRLQTGVKAESRPAPRGLDWPVSGCGIALIDTKGGMLESDALQSKKNHDEAKHLASVLMQVLRGGDLSIDDIGVITPYKGQVRVLRRELPPLLREAGLASDGERLEIASVDAFQGREKELVIFSAVRSNQDGRIGFLADVRRLNVMLTRARRGLIIIGDLETLAQDETWFRYIDWAKKKGFLLSLPA
eukprot:TRINITY_DN45871_c0_g1_i1.p1 TRINITY_DN45871_c0_g1~~TRINITY_DN45871_c0_g1_i1.p1  ORF type:complete len:1238 (-),score=308.34 TRINITY_DN45871_c0_g1_i1:219-3656(-)